MKRRWLIVGTLLLGYAGSNVAFAQVPGGATQAPPTTGTGTGSGTGVTGTGTGTGAGAGADGGKLAEEVKVCKSCCSIFDFMGLGGFKPGGVLQFIGSRAIVQSLKPFGRIMAQTMGLQSTMMAKKFQESKDPTMATAGAVAKKDAQAGAKVAAVKFLAKADCKCHPEVVDAILDALNDCSEIVRYEALKALRNMCKADKQCTLSMKLHHKCGKCGGTEGIEGDEACDCYKCQCDPKVMRRLDQLLRERHPDGCYKERSERIRKLAQVMIQECLSQYQPPPEPEKPRLEGEKKTPPPKPKPESPTTGKSSSIDHSNGQRGTLVSFLRQTQK